MKPVICPKCGHQFKAKDAARALRAIPSERRAAASRENGRKGGRPRTRKGGA